MSNLRQAAQQALEALERGETKLRWAAITALKQALAEPEQEPDGISWLKRDGGYFTAPTPRKPWVGLTVEEIFDCTHHITRIQQDEWVATDDDLCEFADTVAQVLKKKNGYGTWNKPLSKEQIDNICKSFRLGYTDEDLVRAIERAHGIGDSDE